MSTTQRFDGTFVVSEQSDIDYLGFVTARIYPIAGSAVQVVTPANALVNTLASVIIPGGAFGRHGRLRVTALFTSNNNINSKEVVFNLNGNGFFSADLANNTALRAQSELANRGVTNSQTATPAAAGGWGLSTAAIVLLAEDTTQRMTFSITGQKAVAGDTLNLESYLLELIVPVFE